MPDPTKRVMTGGCQCGSVRYALTAAPERVHLCHCRACQKAVGGPFAALAPVRRQDFAWTRGTPASFASSSIAHRDFCAGCGTPVIVRRGHGGTNSNGTSGRTAAMPGLFAATRTPTRGTWYGTRHMELFPVAIRSAVMSR